jgi:hypothetical protein
MDAIHSASDLHDVKNSGPRSCGLGRNVTICPEIALASPPAGPAKAADVKNVTFRPETTPAPPPAGPAKAADVKNVTIRPEIMPAPPLARPSTQLARKTLPSVPKFRTRHGSRVGLGFGFCIQMASSRVKTLRIRSESPETQPALGFQFQPGRADEPRSGVRLGAERAMPRSGPFCWWRLSARFVAKKKCRFAGTDARRRDARRSLETSARPEAATPRQAFAVQTLA